MEALTRCRTCRSNNVLEFLSLGNHPPANAFLTSDQLGRPEAAYPLNVSVCPGCGLIQVPDRIAPGFFRNYLYVPSASAAMRDHFAELAQTVTRRCFSSGDGLALDIGSNDGLFLRALRGLGVRTLGVEPAANLTEAARQKGLDVVNDYFTPATAREILANHGPVRLITTTNTFNHVDDLHAFMEGVTTLLADDGTFLIEVPHSLELVRRNEFDTVYHEHLSQFSITSLVALFTTFDMEIRDVEKLAIHGGSVRVYAKKRQGNPVTSSVVARLIATEREERLFAESTYDAFRERVFRNKEQTLTLLARLRQQGKRVAGYGAPAKGNTLLNYYGIGPDLVDWLADRNPLKHGLYSPGMHIPVVPVERVLEDRPDYLFILAWNFADEIVSQQRAFRRCGGNFIVPIPTPQVLAAA
jgi:hypothetical protein